MQNFALWEFLEFAKKFRRREGGVYIVCTCYLLKFNDCWNGQLVVQKIIINMEIVLSIHWIGKGNPITHDNFLYGPESLNDWLELLNGVKCVKKAGGKIPLKSNQKKRRRFWSKANTNFNLIWTTEFQCFSDIIV